MIIPEVALIMEDHLRGCPMILWPEDGHCACVEIEADERDASSAQ